MSDKQRQADELATASADAMYRADEASQALGITIGAVRPGAAEARMTIRGNMLNGHKICHGGYLFTLADTAFAFACNSYGKVTLAMSATIDFLSPAREGEELLARATEVSRSGRAGIYDVVVTAPDGRQVAVFRGRSLALREDLPLDA